MVILKDGRRVELLAGGAVLLLIGIFWLYGLPWGLLIGLLVLAPGVVMLTLGLHSYAKSRKAAVWSTAAGEIQECEFVESGDADGDTYSFVKVKYSYEALGCRFVGTRIVFGYDASSTGVYGMHDLLYQKLHTAKTVKVLFNPGKPEESVLVAGFNKSQFFIVVFGLGWLTFFPVGYFITLDQVSTTMKVITFLAYLLSFYSALAWTLSKDKALVDKIVILETRQVDVDQPA